jgi:hypothetical protein
MFDYQPLPVSCPKKKKEQDSIASNMEIYNTPHHIVNKAG